MAEIRDLIGELMLVAPGVPEPLAVSRYAEAARRFFTDTRAYREPVSVYGGPGDGGLILGVPDDTEAFDATSVVLDSTPLVKATREQMIARHPSASHGTPKYFRVAAGALHLAPAPDDAQGVARRLRVRAVVRPARGATTLADDLADDFGDIIESGAIARLLTLPGRAWTNYDIATYHRREFQDAVERWQSRAADGGMVGVPRRVRYGGY